MAAPKPTSLLNLGLCSAVGTVDSVCKTGNEIEMNKLKLKQTVSRGLGKPTIEGERHTRQSARVFPAFKDRGTNGTTSVAEGPSSRFWRGNCQDIWHWESCSTCFQMFFYSVVFLFGLSCLSRLQHSSITIFPYFAMNHLTCSQGAYASSRLPGSFAHCWFRPARFCRETPSTSPQVNQTDWMKLIKVLLGRLSPLCQSAVNVTEIGVKI